MQGTHGLKHLGLLAVDRTIALISRRFHGQQRNNLEQVILNDVAQAAGAFVKRAAPFHAEILGQRDLHAGHAVAVPDRFEERIGKAEVEDIHDRLLPEIVVDAEDGIFRKHRQRDAIERPRRRQVASERLLDDDARLVGQTRGTESFDHRSEQRGRDGEVMRRAPGIPQRLPKRRERVRVVVITAHIPEQGKQVVKSAPVIDPAGLPDAVRRPFAQLRQAPLRGGNANHRHLENAAPCHRVERRKNHLVGEVAGHAENNQRISRGHAVSGIVHLGTSFPSHRRLPVSRSSPKASASILPTDDGPRGCSCRP